MSDPLASVFPTLPRDSLARFLALGTDIRLAEGEVLCSPEQMPPGFCILKEGCLQLTRDGHPVSTFQPCAMVGEGSLFRGTYPTVTIAATEPCLLLSIPMATVGTYLEANPEFGYQFTRAILVELTGRLQRTSGLYSENRSLTTELGEKNTALERALSSIAETHEQLVRESLERQRVESEVRDLDRFVLEAPSPMLRVARDGRVTYSNPAAQPILAAWRIRPGGRMPKKWRWLLQEALTLGRVRNGELLANKRYYHLQVTPLEDGNQVNIYGHDISQAKATEARILHLANHDPLTGLANRTRFLEELSQVIETGNHPSLLYLDLDRFKPVNDTYGHHVGDQLLQAVARRLRSATREEDRIARLGGDEFAIIRGSSTDRAELQATAERLVQALGQPFSIDGHRVRIGVSIGIAVAPEDGDTAEQLTRNADQAMYRAKNEGRHRYCFAQAPAGTAPVTRKQDEAAIRRAMARDQFRLHYQPKFELATGIPVGVETFLRWQHPKRGLLMPNDFIGMVERVGLSAELSDWVLRTACGEARAWADAGVPLKLAINLSTAQVKDSGLVASILRVVKETGIPPHRLELEISEPVLGEDQVQMSEVLTAIRELGIDVAIDDFGTGQSSLTFLRRFPIATIKIDESFVGQVEQGGEPALVVRTIIALGQSLGLTVVAEGIETAGQLAFLKENGCDQGQGFFFGRPVPAAEISALLAGPSILQVG